MPLQRLIEPGTPACDTRVWTLHFSERREWRKWLEANHETKAIWLLFYKKHTRKAGISYEDAIDEALAFGWIDGMVRRIDDQRYGLRFTARKPGSIWSKLNIARVEKLLREGKMTRQGMQAFERRTGKVSLAERFKAEEPPVPKDLMDALRRNKKASENFNRFAPSYRRRYLMWLASARTSETRKRRVEEALDLIARNVKSLLKWVRIGFARRTPPRASLASPNCGPPSREAPTPSRRAPAQ